MSEMRVSEDSGNLDYIAARRGPECHGSARVCVCMKIPGTESPGSYSFLIYSDGSRNEPPSRYEPAAILSVDLSIDLLYLIHVCHCVISTLEILSVAIVTGFPKICRFYRKFERLQTREAYILSWWEFMPTIFLWGVHSDLN